MISAKLFDLRDTARCSQGPIQSFVSWLSYDRTINDKRKEFGGVAE